MTLEISRGKSPYQYRIHLHDPLIIQRRLNRHNAHWLNIARLANADEARAALLRLEADEACPVRNDDPEAEWINQTALLGYTGAMQ